MKYTDAGYDEMFFVDDEGNLVNARLNAFTGDPIERTKTSHPYSYEPFEVYNNDYNEKVDQGAYDDRMISWDWDKFSNCCQDAFGNSGQIFTYREPKAIEKFLQLYYGNPKLKLTRIVEGCNVGNGYPYWYFCWNNGE